MRTRRGSWCEPARRCCFFFQAEDGIRDVAVTGVQTCALPISLLEELHEESLRLPSDDPGYALIHGWSESDSCLSSKPMTWWLPYFANSAFASRGQIGRASCRERV